MTWQISCDPGENTGIVLGFYDATTPYQLHHRWQIHRGLDGLIDWVMNDDPGVVVDEFVVEKFILADNDFTADLSGVPIEGTIAYLARQYGAPVIWQTRAAKGELVGYSPGASTKGLRQGERFDFLDKHGLFRAGTDNDDSNDAITHALVSLKRRRHMPTLRAYWPNRRSAAA